MMLVELVCMDAACKMDKNEKISVNNIESFYPAVSKWFQTVLSV